MPVSPEKKTRNRSRLRNSRTVGGKEKQVVFYYLNNIVNHPALMAKETEFLRWVENNSAELFGVNQEDMWHARGRGDCNRKRNGGNALTRDMIAINENINSVISAARAYGVPCNITPVVEEDSGPAPARSDDGGDEKKLPRGIGTVRALLAARDIADITAEGYDPFVDMIFSVFRIAPKFREVLRYMIYCETISLMHSFDRMMFESARYGGKKTLDCRMYSAITGTPLPAVEKALHFEGELIRKGILEKESEFSPSGRQFTGTMFISGLFRNVILSKPPTEAKIKKLVFGKAAAASLTRANFNYVAEEYDLVRDILGNAVKKRVRGVNILVYGEPGTGKTELCKSVARDIGAQLYTLVDNNINTDKDGRVAVLSVTQTLLNGEKDALVLFDEAEDAFTRNPFVKDKYSKLFFNRMLENNEIPVIWISNDIHWMDNAHIRRFAYMLEVRKPDQSAKEEIWKNVCAKRRVRLSGEKIAEYAKAYDIPPSFIDTAVEAAKLVGSNAAIERAVAALQKATKGFVPARERASEVKFAPELLNTDMDLGGLAERLAANGKPEFSLCLYGAPGTGKSAFARYLAEMMGLKVVQKRASDLLDCYIGETEKNIARAFAEARDTKSMLVFDEADSLLRSRNLAVRSWETTQVNEMLTQMECHPYPFVCPTNLMYGLDEASLRRFMFKVKYDFLKPPQVELAFKRFFGVEPIQPLRRLTHLTPGDFAVVKGKQKFLDVSDPAELVRMLELEQAAKGVQAEKMGFV
jgi:SpoVK/Ycf46/Vps4 family AAA+-type ATPase